MPAPYFCAVEGMTAPRRLHDTIEIARAESDRLHAVCGGLRTVRILETIETREPSNKAIARAIKRQTLTLKKPVSV